MTNRLGLCLLAVCVDKYKDAFCAKIFQRLEKRALELGLKALIQKHSFVPTAVCTDQCKGAASDIKKVEAACSVLIDHDWDTYHVIVCVKKRWLGAPPARATQPRRARHPASHRRARHRRTARGSHASRLVTDRRVPDAVET